MDIIQKPEEYKIPNWFLNRQKDIRDGKYSQVMANVLDVKLRDDLERLKKIRAHRGLRHYWRSAFLSRAGHSSTLTLCIAVLVVPTQPSCSRSTHEDHWSSRSDCRCFAQEVSHLLSLIHVPPHFTCT